ncbi:MAG: STAS/SEC14 domain-containing protein [Bacteroidota bacterium]
MFRLLADQPAHVVAFEADGTVTRPDIESLFREIDTVLARGPMHLAGEINGIGGMTLDALRENATRSAGLLTKLNKLKRFAVVTDDAWIRGLAQAQGALLPTEVRAWPRAERAAALAWAAEPLT